jgi:hypothetical protein
MPRRDDVTPGPPPSKSPGGLSETPICEACLPPALRRIEELGKAIRSARMFNEPTTRMSSEFVGSVLYAYGHNYTFH